MNGSMHASDIVAAVQYSINTHVMSFMLACHCVFVALESILVHNVFLHQIDLIHCDDCKLQ